MRRETLVALLAALQALGALAAPAAAATTTPMPPFSSLVYGLFIIGFGIALVVVFLLAIVPVLYNIFAQDKQANTKDLMKIVLWFVFLGIWGALVKAYSTDVTQTWNWLLSQF